MVPGGCTTLLYSFKCKGNNLPVNTAAASTATTSVGAVRTPRRKARHTHTHHRTRNNGTSSFNSDYPITRYYLVLPKKYTIVM